MQTRELETSMQLGLKSLVPAMTYGTVIIMWLRMTLFFQKGII